MPLNNTDTPPNIQHHDTLSLATDKIKAITVYAASHPDLDPRYTEAARDLGAAIARAGYALVNGGGASGLMGAVNDGAIDAGGITIGVIPDFMHDRGWGHKGLSQTIVTHGMHHRKQTMADLSSGVIALPGGVGTFEEILEIMTWRKLGIYTHPAVLLNTLHYYDPLVSMMKHAREQGFIYSCNSLFSLASTPDEAVDIISLQHPK